MKIFLTISILLIFSINSCERKNTEINNESNVTNMSKYYENNDTNTIKYYEIDDTNTINYSIMFVNSQEGLDVIEDPDFSEHKRGTLDYLTEVLIVDEDENTININGIDGKWLRLIIPSIGGWVFSGYLEKKQEIAIDNSKTRIKIENGFVFIDGIKMTFPIYFKFDNSSDDRKTYTIYDIDENNIIHYDEFPLVNYRNKDIYSSRLKSYDYIYKEKWDKYLLPILLYEGILPYLRKSEIFNYIKKIILDNSISIPYVYGEYSLDKIKLPYGLYVGRSYSNFERIREIVGSLESGGGFSLYYTVEDRENIYSLDLGSFSYTMNERKQ
jgi:competence protein ComGC